MSPFAGPASLSQAPVPAGPHCFWNPCPIFTVSKTQEPHKPHMGTPVSTAFIQRPQALQAAVTAGLATTALGLASHPSHCVRTWAEASPGKCHQVLPLLKTLRVPVAQKRHPCFLRLSSHPGPASAACGGLPCNSPIPCNRFSSWACSFPPLVLPPPPWDLQTPEPGAWSLLPLQSASLLSIKGPLFNPAGPCLD